MTDDVLRSRLISSVLSKREDAAQRSLIEEFAEELNFHPIDELMIS